MVIFKVAVEEKTPESPKVAKKPETAVLPSKDEPAKKGTFYISDGSFFSNNPDFLLHVLLSVLFLTMFYQPYLDITSRITVVPV